MRKLPTDADVATLRADGWTAQQIADHFGIDRQSVYIAIRRSKNLPVHGDQYKSPYADKTFNGKSNQPVEHRDTGEGDGYGKALSPYEFYRVQRLNLGDCADLLREWRIPE